MRSVPARGASHDADRDAPRAYMPRLRPPPVPGLARVAAATVMRREPPGEALAAFERDAARALGVAHAVLLGSARAGIVAALAAAGVRAGDEVLIPSYTATCVPAVLRAAGFRVRAARVSPEHLVVTAATLARAATPRTRAVLPTHVEGVVADMDAIGELARARGLVVVEDAAHAIGASWGARPVGAFGAAAVSSLGKGKHVNTLFGGLLVTDDAAVADAVRAARDAHPAVARGRVLAAGALQLALAAATHPWLYPLALHPLIRATAALGVDLPTRLFEDAADAPPALSALAWRAPATWGALGAAQLARLPADRARRRELAARLRAALDARGVAHQRAGGPGDHPLFVTALHPAREALRRALLACGVDTQPTWMRAVRGDDEPADARDPVAVRAEREGLYLPLYAGVDEGRLLAALDYALARAGGGA